MSQEYQYARERAELLGLPIPSKEEWLENEKARKKDIDVADNDENAVVQDLDQSDESAKRIGGGLDELNSILSSTQKKINRFKTVCGSLGTILKIRRGSRPSTPKHSNKDDNTKTTTCAREPDCSEDEKWDSAHNPEHTSSHEQTPSIPHKKIDVSQKMGSHIDKLDSLITKAENAQYSMQHQTKQIKRILK